MSLVRQNEARVFKLGYYTLENMLELQNAYFYAMHLFTDIDFNLLYW